MREDLRGTNREQSRHCVPAGPCLIAINQAMT